MSRIKNTLGTKLRRDMTRAAMQFISIIALCALGTFAFSLLDGTARMVRVTLNTYYEENNLADFWVTLPSADREAMRTISEIEGVRETCARANRDLETTMGDDITISVMAYDGPMDINKPLLRTGELLDESDRRGCLVEERFAEAHDLSVGSRVTVKMAGMEYAFVVRGIVVSPEYIVVSSGIAANPSTYGYILVNARAIEALPLTQIVVTLEADADRDAVQTKIQQEIPEALVVNRGAHGSTARANNDAEMFENMTLIFPILAYSIAALIVMTTLSRMIDNQRMQMGTLKALGFSARQIRNHYLSYAILPSLIGGFVGTVVGHYTLPYLLWDCLIAENEMPYRLEPPISMPAWFMVGLTVIMSIGICLFTYSKSARETTAALLRPKPPKDGKRILAERITFIWTRLSFNAKMIVRNLMRNKMRTFISFVGLMVCNMLIILSFGLQDSVTLLAENYYTKTLNYDVCANLTGSVGEADAYERRLDAEAVECVMKKSISLRTSGGTRTVLLTVLEEGQTMIHLGEGQTLIDILPEKAAITQKLSTVLNVKIGDIVTVYLPGDDEPFTIEIGQIVESSFQQGLFVGRETWKGLRKGRFVPTQIQLRAPTEQCIAELNDMDEVNSIDYPALQIGEALRMLDTLSSVFTIITGIALALAFVICYSMGLMNFVERMREYATLKVLGYHQKEIRGLILGENRIIALLAVVLGIYPGILLTNIVMHSCEPESGFYVGTATIQTIVLACVITFCFSELLQRFLTRKVKKIDMVEALKSVE